MCMFQPDFFIGNRNRLREACADTSLIIMTANGLLQRASDETFPFQQDASFWYLTGINTPDTILVMDGDKEYLIVPGRSASREAFDGAVSWGDLSEQSGIQTVYDEKEGWKQLNKRLKKANTIATLAALPRYVEGWDFYANPARAVLCERVKVQNESLEIIDIRSKLARMRMIKQPQEILAIKEAIRITNAAIKDVSKPAKLEKYEYEYEIEADLSAGFRKRGARGHAFSPIVAGGKNACVLHYLDNNSPLTKGDFVVMDVGASYQGYAADITRTICVGEPSKRQRAVYDAVRAAQEYAYTLLKPGIDLREYEHAMEQFVGEKLRELGLIRSILHDRVRHYFPHATSHFLGLDTHDSGDYDAPLAEGVVMTVEPGIYIPEEGIGVRLEDDVLITADGVEVLSA